MSRQADLPSTSSNQPGFFYGYAIAIASLVVMTLTFGLNYTFGVFFQPLMGEFGWTRAVTSAAYSICTLVSGFWGIFAGRISDKLSPQLVGIIGGIGLGLGFFLMSRVSELWHVYLIYGVVIALGIGGVWPMLLATVAKWFVARRGLMTGILATGVGLGTILTPPLATWLISNYDWRSAYTIVGAGTGVLIIAASFFIRRDPYQMGKLPYGIKQQGTVAQEREFDFRGVVFTRQFWMVCGVYFCFGYCLHSVMVHIVPHATALGIPKATAANILVAIGGTTIVAKILVGLTSDRVGIKPMVVSAFIVLTIAFIWLQGTGELWGLYLFGITFGFAYGGVMTMQSLLLAELFGLGSLGVIVGGVTFLYTIGGAIGPFLAGQIYDMTSSYRPAFIICAALSVIAIVLTLLLRPVETKK